MSSFVRCFLFLSLLALTYGCAVRNVYDYRSTPVVLPVKGSYALSLKVDDQRPYVLSGKKDANFVGLRRGGYGNPFNVTTASNKPLADDVFVALTQSLTNAGYSLQDSGQASRNLELTIREWKSDVFTNLKILFDVDLTVYGSAGQMLAKSTITGEEAAGGGAMMAQHSESVRRAFEAKMALLFADPEVKAALTN